MSPATESPVNPSACNSFDASGNSTIPAFGPQLKDQEQMLQDFFSTPLFMDNDPGAQIESNETLSALQSLIYDCPPEEIATNFKNHGNEEFQAKNYSEALVYYQKAIDAQCSDASLNSLIFSNRAAVQLVLQNYRKCLNDCSNAIKLDLSNIKAYYRSVKALKALEKYDDALKCCELGLLVDASNEALMQEIKTITEKKNAILLKNQLKITQENELKIRNQKLIQMVISRGIKMIDSSPKNETNAEAGIFGSLSNDYHVQLDLQSNRLLWPVMFLYPEYQESDFITSFHEDTSFSDHLNVIFEGKAPWDLNREYSADTVDVYFETKQDHADNHLIFKPKLLRVGNDMTLGSVICHEEYKIVDGIATFFIVPRGSVFAEMFKNGYKA